MNHPSKEQEKRARFVASDLIDVVEGFLTATDRAWVDELASVERAKMREYVHYVRTGESTL